MAKPDRTNIHFRRGGSLVIIAASLSFMASAAPAEPIETPAVPPDLVQALQAYDEATMRSDTTALAGLVTDDYMLVNSDASVQDKASYLADFLVPGFKIEPYKVDRPVLRMLGETGLTGGVFKLGWTLNGRRESRDLRIAHVWVRRMGRWQIAYTQLTRVPQ